MRKTIFFGLVLHVLVMLNVSLALNPQRMITQYACDSWGIKDGLPDSPIYDIIQSRDGYIWMGTARHLVRFDGVRFEVYGSNELGIALEEYGFIKKIFSDRYGTLWIISEFGNLIRMKNGIFKLYSMDDGLCDDIVRSIIEDQNGNLWFGTNNGLSRLKNGEFTSYTTKNGLPSNIINSISEDPHGRLWFGTDAGLTRFENDKFITYTTKDGLSNDKCYYVYVDRKGRLWIGTQTNLDRLETGKFMSLYKFRKRIPRNTPNRPAYERLIKIVQNQDGTLLIKTSEKFFRINPKDNAITSYDPQIINTIFKDKDENIWIGAMEGLKRYENGRFSSLTTKDGLSDDWVYSIFEDREGSLWIGTSSGLSRLREKKYALFTNREGLPDGPVKFYNDRVGNMWFTSGRGLYQLRGRKITKYTTKDGLLSDIAHPIYEDSKGVLWITTPKGLNRLVNGKIEAYNPKELSHERVDVVYEDRNRNFWFLTRNDLHCLKNGEFIPFTAKDGLLRNSKYDFHEDRTGSLWFIVFKKCVIRIKDGKLTSFTKKSGLSANHIIDLHEDEAGNMWFTAKNGLNCFKNGKFNLFTTEHGLSANFVFKIFEDQERNIWVINRKGFIRLKDREFKNITYMDGLPFAAIKMAIFDDQGNLWYACSKGICKMKKQDLEDFFSGKIEKVPQEILFDKVIIDGPSYSSTGSIWGLKSGDGKLWFYTVKGVVMIDPKNIPFNNIIPGVKIEKIAVDKIDSLPPFNAKGKKLTFSPGKRLLKIRYTGLSLLEPEKVFFKYKLEGYDKEWQDVGTRRTAYYTKVPPGDYVFRVKACNNDGVWNEKGASVPLYFEPYFYQTTWFIILSIVFFLIAIFSLYRLRVRRLKLRQKELTEEVKSRTIEIEEKNLQLQDQSEKLKEMDVIKSRFFANISHEFRTPLTLLMGPLEQMIDRCPVNESQKKHRLTMMLRNAQRLLRLINQLLELSKLDSGKMKLQAVKTPITPFIKGIADSFRFMALQKELELLFHGPTINQKEEDDLLLYIDPRKMEDVMSNLLVNALKFTQPGGQVIVAIRSDKSPQDNFPLGWVEISVRDTGSGIPIEIQEHIFDRFYQAEHFYETQGKGSGIGLSLSKELVQLHHGTIQVHSAQGEGTTFTIRLHLGKDHLSAEDMAQPGAIPNGAGAAMDTFIDQSSVDVLEIENSLPEVDETDKEIILVVEDSTDMREYIKAALEPHYTVIEAVEGKEGVEKAQTYIPDLVVSDIMMPHMDGYQLCKILKNDRQTSHIPVILLTAKASEEHIVAGLETGADDYITKPFSMNILLARIKNLIDIRRQLQENVYREMSLKPVKTKVSTIDREFLDDLQTVLKEYMSDPDFNVEQLCKRLYMGNTTLYRKIRALCGQTPTEFIRTYRLKRAAEMLRNGQGSVTEVAFEAGFSSRAYFTKCFKETFHTLPSTFASSRHNACAPY
jgi:signal transduction histidine kinase/ligand-binding sensor domain-containing protein/DNA-binding NarL/FixJ family response regulator